MKNWSDFLFLRHGQTDWNVEGRFQGQTDIPLNATGLAQATSAAKSLAGQRIDRIIASPLSRALTTARIVADQLALDVEIDPLLTERTFGPLEGQVVHDVKQQLAIPPTTPIAGHLPPEAEQWTETLSRTRRAIGHWLENHPQEHLLFVSHHGLSAALSELLIGERLEGRNAVPYVFQRRENRWSVRELE